MWELLHARACVTNNVFFNLLGAEIGGNEQDMRLLQGDKLTFQ